VVALHSGLGWQSVVLGLLAAITVLDQSTKWWGWRHVSTASINSGGDVLVGATVGAWYADPVQGLLLDLLDFGLLSIAISVLMRRRQSLVVLISECMMVGGWASNLLDRLVMHDFTAPGSDRGAVDFIPFGSRHYNVADLFIIVGTLLFVLALGSRLLQGRMREAPATSRPLTPTSYDRRPVPAGAFGGVDNSWQATGVSADRGKTTSQATSSRANIHPWGAGQ
jgi:lipoprotein signal peptidase